MEVGVGWGGAISGLLCCCPVSRESVSETRHVDEQRHRSESSDLGERPCGRVVRHSVVSVVTMGIDRTDVWLEISMDPRPRFNVSA